MTQSIIIIPEKIYRDVLRHLIPKRARLERVAFIFATTSISDEFMQFKFKSWYPVKKHEYEHQSSAYVELKDKMRPKIIKMAFDCNAAIIELHSHPRSQQAYFSSSDLYGFKDFVPHVWWRLKGKPYAAIVVSNYDFDGLVWIDDPENPQRLTEIIAGEERLYPNNFTLFQTKRRYRYEF